MRTHSVMLGLMWVAVLTASACGGGKSGSEQPATDAAAAGRTASGDATAEEVAEEQRGRLRCPAKAVAAPSGAPVHDIQGVRPGMRLADASPLVLCSHPLLVATSDSSNRFNLETHGVRLVQGFSASFARPRVERSSKEILADMQQAAMDRGNNRVKREVMPGEMAWTLGVMGMPGDEVVTDVAREEWYAAGQEPAVSSVEEALVAKYGTPTFSQRSDQQQLLRWAYLPSGARVQDQPGYTTCTTNPFRNSPVNYTDACGIVVEVVIQSMPSNPALAQATQLRSVNQVAAVERITATAEQLQQREMTRRNAQLNDAKKRGVAPTF